MGTLFNQPVRRGYYVDLEREMEIIEMIAEEKAWHIKDVIALKHAAELERRNNLMKINGDIWDEQIAGIGELIRDIVNPLNEYLHKLSKDEYLNQI